MGSRAIPTVESPTRDKFVPYNVDTLHNSLHEALFQTVLRPIKEEVELAFEAAFLNHILPEISFREKRVIPIDDEYVPEGTMNKTATYFLLFKEPSKSIKRRRENSAYLRIDIDLTRDSKNGMFITINVTGCVWKKSPVCLIIEGQSFEEIQEQTREKLAVAIYEWRLMAEDSMPSLDMTMNAHQPEKNERSKINQNCR